MNDDDDDDEKKGKNRIPSPLTCSLVVCQHGVFAGVVVRVCDISG